LKSAEGIQMYATGVHRLEMQIFAWLSFTCFTFFCKEAVTKTPESDFAVELLPVNPLEPSSQLQQRLHTLVRQDLLATSSSMLEMHQRAEGTISFELANGADMFGVAMTGYR
jgi:hypothetical protein